MAQRKRFRIPDFSGGMNPDQSPYLIGDNEAAEIYNFRIDQVGSLISRHGYSAYVPTNSAHSLLALGRWSDGSNPPSTQILAANVNGEIVEVDAAGDVFDVLYSGMTGGEGMFLPVQNYLVYTNGTDVPVAYDGTDVARLGIDAPVAAPATSLAGTGITGTYQYVYTYFSTQAAWESNPSPETAEVVAADDTVSVTFVASAHPFVDKIRLYRTVDGGTTFLLVEEVDNVIGPYEDTTEDADLAPLSPVFTNHIAPAFENIAYHKGYLFGSIGDTLYWSKALNIGAYPAVNSTKVPFDGNDTITALKSYQDTLLIFGRRNTILVAGDGGVWALIRQDVEVGCTSRKALAEVEDTLVFLSDRGLYTFPGFAQYALKLTRQVNQSNGAFLTAASLVYVPQERALWLSVNDRTWVIHVLNQGLSVYTFYGHQFLSGGISGSGLPVWIEADTALDTVRENIYQYGGHTDLEEDIFCRWVSKVYQFEVPETSKYFRRVGVPSTLGVANNITVSVGDTLNQYSAVVTQTGGYDESLWNVFEWDLANWSQEGLGYFIAALPAQTLLSRVIQVAIAGLTASPVEITPPVSLEYRETDRFLGA